MEWETGFEPATSTLARSHSTTELLPLAQTKDPGQNKSTSLAADASRPPALLVDDLPPPGMRASRALPGRRLDAHTWEIYFDQGP